MRKYNLEEEQRNEWSRCQRVIFLRDYELIQTSLCDSWLVRNDSHSFKNEMIESWFSPR